jgi:hypothetical protein
MSSDSGSGAIAVCVCGERSGNTVTLYQCGAPDEMVRTAAARRDATRALALTADLRTHTRSSFRAAVSSAQTGARSECCTRLLHTTVALHCTDCARTHARTRTQAVPHVHIRARHRSERRVLRVRVSDRRARGCASRSLCMCGCVWVRVCLCVRVSGCSCVCVCVTAVRPARVPTHARLRLLWVQCPKHSRGCPRWRHRARY